MSETYTEEQVRVAVTEEFVKLVHDHTVTKTSAQEFALIVHDNLTRPQIDPDVPVMYDYMGKALAFYSEYSSLERDHPDKDRGELTVLIPEDIAKDGMRDAIGQAGIGEHSVTGELILRLVETWIAAYRRGE